MCVVLVLVRRSAISGGAAASASTPRLLDGQRLWRASSCPLWPARTLPPCTLLTTTPHACLCPHPLPRAVDCNSGMGCSVGVVAVSLVRDMLKVRRTERRPAAQPRQGLLLFGVCTWKIDR